MSRPDFELCTCAGGRPCCSCSTADEHKKDRPNLLKAAAAPHSEACSRAVFLKDEVGDVRECEHGKIQVVKQPYINSPGVLVWRDLHWFWDQPSYRLAKQLLQDARPRPGTSTTTLRRVRGAL